MHSCHIHCTMSIITADPRPLSPPRPASSPIVCLAPKQRPKAAAPDATAGTVPSAGAPLAYRSNAELSALTFANDGVVREQPAGLIAPAAAPPLVGKHAAGPTATAVRAAEALAAAVVLPAPVALPPTQAKPAQAPPVRDAARMPAHRGPPPAYAHVVAPVAPLEPAPIAAAAQQLPGAQELQKAVQLQSTATIPWAAVQEAAMDGGRMLMPLLTESSTAAEVRVKSV